MAAQFLKATTADEVIAFAKEHQVKFVDFKFTDLLGTWQHVTTSAQEAFHRTIPEGIPFDGSSIRGWKVINSSDMLALPDYSTAWVDPFHEIPTLSLICSIYDPITKQRYERDPRGICENAVAYLQTLGIGDTAYFAPEAEFFIFDDVRYGLTNHGCSYEVDSSEGIWNSAREEFPNLAYKLRHKEGYFPVPPADSQHNLRNEMCLLLEELGLPIERHHHEVASAGQNEINFVYDTMVQTGDNLQLYKYVVRNVARRHNKTATFLPKPLFGDNGSGMHTHQSIWKDGKPTFAGDRYAGLSQTALFYIGGLIHHARALTAITNPTTNSFKRLVPGFEAPVNFAYSARNRSAAIRIPIAENPKAKRIEFRTPDGMSCIYLALAAQLMAGLDGIVNRLDPGDPLDKNIYELPPEELAHVPSAPDSLKGAVEALQADHEFLLKGDVFTRDLIETLCEMEIKDYDELRLRPHPFEFYKYYDA